MQLGQLKRRHFIMLLGGAAAWPIAARAQQHVRVRHIGMVVGGLAPDDPEMKARKAAFLEGLQQLGWNGHNLRIDYRWGLGNADNICKYAVELVALAPDVVLVSGSATMAAMQQATRTVPIVFVGVVDPVGNAFVDSLSQPGGNVTGFDAAYPRRRGHRVRRKE